MKRPWMLVWSCLLTTQLHGQPAPDRQLADEIVASANEAFDCVLKVLFVRFDQATRSTVAHVEPRGDACGAALDHANEFGWPHHISFSQLIMPKPPRQPPKNFDLIHEVIQ